MRYALLLNHHEPTEGEIPEADLKAAEAAFDAYAKALHDAGVLRSADIMAPSQLTTSLTLRNGSLEVQDGPFAESKEMMGGVFVIDVPDLDAALAWAEQCPAAHWGVIEVRPVAITFEDGAWRE